MKCDGCKFAEWDRTSSGRLHPMKLGWCRAKIPDFDIPPAFTWPGAWGSTVIPQPYGGRIDMGRDLHRDCNFRQEA